MSASTTFSRGLDLRARADAALPRRTFAGLASGFRAYRVYSDLAGRSDGELQRLGLNRADLPRIAFEAM